MGVCLVLVLFLAAHCHAQGGTLVTITKLQANDLPRSFSKCGYCNDVEARLSIRDYADSQKRKTTGQVDICDYGCSLRRGCRCRRGSDDASWDFTFGPICITRAASLVYDIVEEDTLTSDDELRDGALTIPVLASSATSSTSQVTSNKVTASFSLRSTCPVGEQYSTGCASSTQVRCAACSNRVCGTNLYQVGLCSGSVNGFRCITCDRITCGADQYRTGFCGGRTNGYQCRTCSRITCPAGFYRTGTCSGTSDGYQCRPCSTAPNATCPAGFYRTGECGSYQCVPCGAAPNATCPAEFYRTGSCLSAATTFSCVACAQHPNYQCAGDEFRTGECGGSSLGYLSTYQCSSCSAHPSGTCAEGTYQDGVCGGGGVASLDCISCEGATNFTCGAGFYRTGDCGPSIGNNYVCESCATAEDAVCADGFVRLGDCAGTSVTYQCVSTTSTTLTTTTQSTSTQTSTTSTATTVSTSTTTTTTMTATSTTVSSTSSTVSSSTSTRTITSLTTSLSTVTTTTVTAFVQPASSSGGVLAGPQGTLSIVFIVIGCVTFLIILVIFLAFQRRRLIKDKYDVTPRAAENPVYATTAPPNNAATVGSTGGSTGGVTIGKISGSTLAYGNPLYTLSELAHETSAAPVENGPIGLYHELPKYDTYDNADGDDEYTTPTRMNQDILVNTNGTSYSVPCVEVADDAPSHDTYDHLQRP